MDSVVRVEVVPSSLGVILRFLEYTPTSSFSQQEHILFEVEIDSPTGHAMISNIMLGLQSAVQTPVHLN